MDLIANAQETDTESCLCLSERHCDPLDNDINYAQFIHAVAID